jgi:prevent-host-death family protein
MIEVTISEFKAKCGALVEKVRRTRQPIRITRNGKPIAELVPPAPLVSRSAMCGSMKGVRTIKGDIISPANDEDDWEVLRDPDRVVDPAFDILRIIGEESKANGTDKLTSREIDKIIRSTRAKKSKR